MSPLGALTQLSGSTMVYGGSVASGDSVPVGKQELGQGSAEAWVVAPVRKRYGRASYVIAYSYAHDCTVAGSSEQNQGTLYAKQ